MENRLEKIEEIMESYTTFKLELESKPKFEKQEELDKLQEKINSNTRHLDRLKKELENIDTKEMNYVEMRVLMGEYNESIKQTQKIIDQNNKELEILVSEKEKAENPDKTAEQKRREKVQRDEKRFETKKSLKAELKEIDNDIEDKEIELKTKEHELKKFKYEYEDQEIEFEARDDKGELTTFKKTVKVPKNVEDYKRINSDIEKINSELRELNECKSKCEGYIQELEEELNKEVEVINEIISRETKTAPTNQGPTNQEPTKPEPTKPEPTNLGPTKPEPTNLGPTKPEPTKPEPTKPEPTKPEPTKPESTKSEQTKPESTKPESTKSEQTKPEQTKSNLQALKSNLKDIQITVCPIANTITLTGKNARGEEVTIFEELDYSEEFANSEEVKKIINNVQEKLGREIENVEELDPNILVMLYKSGCKNEAYKYATVINKEEIKEEGETNEIPFEVNYDLKDIHKSELLYNEEKTKINNLAKTARDVGANVSRDNIFKRAFDRVKSLIGRNTRRALVEDNKNYHAYELNEMKEINKDRAKFIDQIRMQEKYEQYKQNKQGREGYYAPGTVRTREQNNNFKAMDDLAKRLQAENEAKMQAQSITEEDVYEQLSNDNGYEPYDD